MPTDHSYLRYEGVRVFYRSHISFTINKRNVQAMIIEHFIHNQVLTSSMTASQRAHPLANIGERSNTEAPGCSEMVC